MTPEAHRGRHEVLHAHFDELLADFLRHNRDATPSNTTITDLVMWSYRQTIKADEE